MHLHVSGRTAKFFVRLPLQSGASQNKMFKELELTHFTSSIGTPDNSQQTVCNCPLSFFPRNIAFILRKTVMEMQLLSRAGRQETDTSLTPPHWKHPQWPPPSHRPVGIWCLWTHCEWVHSSENITDIGVRIWAFLLGSVRASERPVCETFSCRAVTTATQPLVAWAETLSQEPGCLGDHKVSGVRGSEAHLLHSPSIHMCLKCFLCNDEQPNPTSNKLKLCNSSQ